MPPDPTNTIEHSDPVVNGACPARCTAASSSPARACARADTVTLTTFDAHRHYTSTVPMTGSVSICSSNSDIMSDDSLFCMRRQCLEQNGLPSTTRAGLVVKFIRCSVSRSHRAHFPVSRAPRSVVSSLRATSRRDLRAKTGVSKRRCLRQVASSAPRSTHPTHAESV